ncbi:MAG TPA: EAL domain-containing protein [Gemmatimonadaceae bacterium]|nr:EAL domain-containing protein [Gemmatimonadaceae bacterium]
MFGPHTFWTILAEAAVYLGVLGAGAWTYRAFARRHRKAAVPSAAAQDASTTYEHLQIVEQAANDGIWYWDRERDRMHFSARWKELLGFGETDIGSSSAEWFGRIHPADTSRVQLEIYSHICGETDRFESRHRLLAADGNYRWVVARGLAVRNDAGAVVRIGGSLTDVSLLMDAEKRLASEVMHDELTRLPNRGYFMEVVERATVRTARREGYQFAVLFLDLDGFKAVNDSHGHAVGDELLVAVARKLETCVRPGDVVARLGGDEFTILLDDIESGSDATRVAARIVVSLRQPIQVATGQVTVAASIGIALSDGVTSTDELIRSADLAMYRAKGRGRGRYEVFDRAMHSEAVARLRLESELRHAVERREFQLFYQPMVDSRTGAIRAMEVLMRWNHPERGVVPADEFITVANQTGLIVTLGTWMLRESCHQVARWQEMFPSTPPLKLSVNFCRREMQNPDLFARIEQLLAETGLQPGSLRIEITEASLAESFDESPSTYLDLARIGVGFQIDDFGTGTASLSLLHRFPVSAIKIDRSFVFDITERAASREIVSYINAIAMAMEVEVIAEGVETEEQERCLSMLGCCTLVQGYRYSKPLAASGAEALLQLQHHQKSRLAS